jgi:hypothetical protein
VAPSNIRHIASDHLGILSGPSSSSSIVIAAHSPVSFTNGVEGVNPTASSNVRHG